jgi:polysaccharide biosynthesis transport protein
MSERLPPGPSSNQLIPSSGGALEATGGLGGLQPTGPDEGATAGMQISRLIAAVLRYKWLVLAISVLGTAGAVAATRFIDPEYRAAGTIYIEANTKSRGGPIQAAELLQQDSWAQLMRSFAVLDPVVRKTRLYLSVAPADSAVLSGFDLAARFRPGRYRLRVDAAGRRFTLQNTQGFVVDTGAVGDSIGRPVGFRWAPPASVLGRDREVAFTVRAPRDASNDLLSSLRISMPGNDGVFMNVSLTGTDAEQTAMLVNAILDQFVDLADRLKKEKAVQLTADLEKQLQRADSATRVAETALENYRINTITEPREDVLPLPSGLAQTQPTVMGNYFAKRTQLSAIRRDRRAIEEVLTRGRREGVVHVDAFHTIGIVKQAPGLMGVLSEVVTVENEIRAAQQRYTDEHKVVRDLKVKLDDLRTRTVPAFAERLVIQLREQEADLERELEIEQDELRKIPVRSLTEEKFRREATAAVGLTQTLQNRLTDARLAELAATPDVTILDRAEAPTRASASTAPRIILMGVAASIGFALLLAILLDRLDKRFRYPEQATYELGLTILGAVPVIRRETRGLRSPAETAQIVEAFRSIRLNLSHSFPADDPIVVTITSPSPGDGKSLISANLAISFAEAGYETLLIDGDTRRGEQYRTFQVPRRPGLLDHLDLGLDLDTIIHATQHDRLSVLPCGSRMPRGPELLGSSRMSDLVATLRRRFQVILVDSPPLGAGVDPFVLGTATGAVAVVLRAGETDRQLAEAKLQLMERLPTRLVGAILNHIDVGHGAYKYYAYEYVSDTEPPVEEPVGTEAPSSLPGSR